MKAILVLCLLFALAAPAFSIKLKSTKPHISSPKIDLCPTCVSFFDNAIEQLVEIIANGGIIGTCGDLCGQLPNQIESVICDLVCDYVGITALIDALDELDPSPIYICQLIELCNYTDNGAANITSTFVNPKVAKQGQTIELGFQYAVFSRTSVGGLVININPPDAFPFGDNEFSEGQDPGKYQISWQLQLQPSENEPFTPGVYEVDFAICAGDCTTIHPHSGIYSAAITNFTIVA